MPNPTANDPLVAYTSSAAHGCVARALEISGIGSDALRLIETDDLHRMDVHMLERAITSDRREGLLPFLIVGTAGSVDIGAIDDLAAIARVARSEKLWFHVDGAYGALAVLAPEISGRLKGSRALTPSPSTFTSGARFHTMRGSFWCGTGRSTMTRSPHGQATWRGTPGGLQVDRRGRVTLDWTSPAASRP
jgi:cysteine sulfinate desulfinase/cysteine desulfurase-like protein